MPDLLSWPLAVGIALGAVAVLVPIALRRFAHGQRELGSDTEQATYRTLSLASRAAVHLRGGLDGPDVRHALRWLRALLDAEGIALVAADGSVVADGAPRRGPDAGELAAEAIRSHGPVVRDDSADDDRPGAVAVPVRVGEEVAGALVAYAAPLRPPLVRAATEVAEWCGAQLGLGELDASRAALAEAELRSLRAQISPHFVYNALGAIASFIRSDPDRAHDLVLDFADFTRYSFRRRGEFTTLADELRSVHAYIELERARFDDRLTVTLQVEPEILTTVIPFLSLQPLVENAVRHGLEPLPAGGEIVIAARDDGTHTEITVDDDGVGMEPARLRELLGEPPDGRHVGLRNVDARLRRIYGDDHALVLETAPGSGTMVRMRVPRSQPFHEPDTTSSP